jgi:PAS domain S-box-containing protein
VNVSRPSLIDSSIPDFQKLVEAFDLFNSASSLLQNSYQELQIEAKRLSEELETANVELIRSLHEKESVQNYLKNILESLSNGVLVVNPEGQVTICNPAAVRLLELPPDFVAGNTRYDHLPLRREIKDLVHQVLESSGQSLEDIELSWDTPGGVLKSLNISSSPIRDLQNCCLGVTVILRDTSRLKELEAQTQRTQKLQTMGEMAVQLAHEIRNPLGSIELFASLLQGELEGDPELKGWAEQITTGIQFLNTIVTNMLTFARTSKAQFREFDLRHLVCTTLRFIEPILKQRRIRLESPMDGDPVLYGGDPEMLRQMLMNLFMNALQAMPEEGKLNVRLETEHGESVLIEVEDNGIGIAAEHLPRIFDPFFTTSESGTGLGLSLAHQIVQKHSGQITARSRMGEGTCFRIRLPWGRHTGC